MFKATYSELVRVLVSNSLTFYTTIREDVSTLSVHCHDPETAQIVAQLMAAYDNVIVYDYRKVRS